MPHNPRAKFSHEPGIRSRLPSSPVTSPAEKSVLDFLCDGSCKDLPGEVVAQGKRCLLDLLGVAAAGSVTAQAAIVREHVAADEAGPDGARILFDGRRVSLPGAAWANATAIESLDGHDGHSLTKGHAGVALLPAILAVAERCPVGLDDAALLASLVNGYELAIRCGLALHATAPDYHSSGAWNSVATAVVCSQLLGGAGEDVLHAAGIAEYFAPRGPMMRCIAVPSMVKDSSAWGSRVGVEAALLARRGFTGRPAELLTGPAGGRGSAGQHRYVAGLFADLGDRWRILELYFKPYPVCRWAQPAVEAALVLRTRYRLSADDVDRVEIASFRQAVALHTAEPRDTEEAQYSLPYAVAAALRFGSLGASEVDGESLTDPVVLRLSRGTRLREVPRYTERFPAERLADVTVVTRDGRRLDLREATCRGDPSRPMPDEDVVAKFHALAGPVITEETAALVERAIAGMAPHGDGPSRLGELLFSPAPLAQIARARGVGSRPENPPAWT
jgi:2-methylcitrate dehydratase PrpD